MKISGMVKNSFVDYPGQIACVLFVPGCNFDCFYCHNRHLIESPPESIAMDAVFSFLQKRLGQLDGVVVTGGEPTLQPGLIPFLRDVKALGYRVKLDTNGSSPMVVKQLLEANLCDYYAVDAKAPSQKYPAVCGDRADATQVFATIRLLVQANAAFEVRTTVFPQLSLDDLLQMAAEIPVVPRYVLNRYRKPDGYKPCDEARINQRPYTQAEINAFAEALRTVQPGTTC